MKCPYCDCEEDKVVDSRSWKDGRAVRRRRECLECGRRFTTYEYIETIPLMVIKRDATAEPYDRQKLMNGVVTACKKRPVSRKDIEELVNRIESEVQSLDTVEVKSRQLGELVMDSLRELDSVAYVRFASVYRNFKDSSEFMNEIKSLLESEVGLKK